MLTWDWKKKIGVAEYQMEGGKPLTISLYKGNALIIMLYEYTDNNGNEKYQLINFFTDIQHLNNCFKDKDTFKSIMHDFKKFEFLEIPSKDIWKFIMKISEFGIPVTINLPFKK